MRRRHAVRHARRGLDRARARDGGLNRRGRRRRCAGRASRAGHRAHERGTPGRARSSDRSREIPFGTGRFLLRVRAPRPEPTCGPGAIRASPRARAVSENGAAAGRATPPGASASGATRTDDAISSICRTPENTRQFEPATDTTEMVARSENSAKSLGIRNESKSERLRRRSRRWYVQRRLIYESSDGRRVSPGSGARERTLRASDGGCADRRTRTRAALDARGERARRHATRLLSSRRSVSLFVIRAHLSRRARSSAHRRRRIEAARCYVSSSVWILDEHVAVTESASSASERFRELQRF